MPAIRTSWPTTKPSTRKLPLERVTLPPAAPPAIVTGVVIVTGTSAAVTVAVGAAGSVPVRNFRYITVLSVVSSGWSSPNPVTRKVDTRPPSVIVTV